MKQPIYPRLMLTEAPALRYLDVFRWLVQLETRRLMWHMDDPVEELQKFNAQARIWSPLFTDRQMVLARKDRQNALDICDGKQGGRRVDIHSLCAIAHRAACRARKAKQ